VSQSKVTPGAIAINWILKDGAGRVGKMLFARQGKKFDYDLKQLRFSSDLLLEIGAGIELATAAFPQFFLPMACVANVVKNVAAVTSTSTRTPIYKA
ncbi:RUS1 family protein, partial [Shewanella sp. A3A]|nr:RUS1 family protein [Shewanella ferrihydritica]